MSRKVAFFIAWGEGEGGEKRECSAIDKRARVAIYRVCSTGAEP